MEKDQGRWNEAEWFPSLIRSSIYLGKLPSSLSAMGRMDWIPVDILAKALVETILENDESTRSDSPVLQDADEAKSARFIHLLNPQQADWQHIIPHIQAVLSKSLEIVSYEEWLGELQNSAEQEHDEANSAVKLIDFFEENGKELKPKFSTARAQELSKTLATLGPVNGEWMELWMKQWGLDSSRANL